MLIIERRAGESIQIGDEMRVCVLDTDGERVRLGVTTPRDVPVTPVEETPDTPTLVEQQITSSAPAAEQKEEGRRCWKDEGEHIPIPK